jgi:hypothetical protein
MQKIKMQTAKSFEIHRVCILHFAFCIQVVHFFSNLLGRGIQLAFWFRSEVVDGQVEQEGRDVRESADRQEQAQRQVAAR